MDRYTVPMLLHDRAIYLHNATQYQVEKLDFPAKRAYIKHVDVDYYTDADLSVSLRVLDEFEQRSDGCVDARPRRGARLVPGDDVQEDEV